MIFRKQRQAGNKSNQNSAQNPLNMPHAIYQTPTNPPIDEIYDEIDDSGKSHSCNIELLIT